MSSVEECEKNVLLNLLMPVSFELAPVYSSTVIAKIPQKCFITSESLSAFEKSLKWIVFRKRFAKELLFFIVLSGFCVFFFFLLSLYTVRCSIEQLRYRRIEVCCLSIIFEFKFNELI